MVRTQGRLQELRGTGSNDQQEMQNTALPHQGTEVWQSASLEDPEPRQEHGSHPDRDFSLVGFQAEDKQLLPALMTKETVK